MKAASLSSLGSIIMLATRYPDFSTLLFIWMGKIYTSVFLGSPVAVTSKGGPEGWLSRKLS